MPSLKEDMMKIHQNTDYKVNFAGVTEPNEFVYAHGGTVQPNLEYHMHFTNNKTEVYMTGGVHTSESKVITKIKGEFSNLEIYTGLKTDLKVKYPTKFRPSPNESDYRIGDIQRYFCQKANDVYGEIQEISRDDFDANLNLFRYFDTIWYISGKKSEVLTLNNNIIVELSKERGNENIRKILYPLQFWKPSDDETESLKRKLGRLKNTLVIPEVIPEQQSDTNNNPLDNPRTDDDEYADFDNIVRDENGNPVIGFTDGTRVDLTESGP